VELVEEAARQTFPDGFNRELAMDYHLFVLDILIASSLAARLAGAPLDSRFDDVLRRMSDALAAAVDGTGRPARFGDGDDGRALSLDGGGISHAGGLLGAAAALFGPASWWPEQAQDDSILRRIAASTVPVPAPARATVRPGLLPDAGIAFLRCGVGTDEIWLRCDHGRLGFLSIAAHGHADTLSVELREGGIEILADPGTYCYHSEPVQRRYFKGTTCHNTLTVDGMDQAEFGGPFLWLGEVPTRLEHFSVTNTGSEQIWQACHMGYRRLTDPVTHHRRVMLDTASRVVHISDWLEAGGDHIVTLSFHFGPAVMVAINDRHAELAWHSWGGARGAVMELPAGLQWSLQRGASDPLCGWYSEGFAHKEPAFTLIGHGKLGGGTHLTTHLHLPTMQQYQSRKIQEAECATHAAY
jgi:hypothetical protein